MFKRAYNCPYREHVKSHRQSHISLIAILILHAQIASLQVFQRRCGMRFSAPPPPCITSPNLFPLNNIWSRANIKKLLILQLTPSPSYFFYTLSLKFTSASCSQTFSIYLHVPPLWWDKFHTHIKTNQNIRDFRLRHEVGEKCTLT
jgi:hypothetical protein